MSDVSRLDRRNRARTMSWLGMGEDAGGVLGPMLAGFLWNGWGIGALMMTRVLLAATSEIYALAVARRIAPDLPRSHAAARPLALASNASASSRGR